MPSSSSAPGDAFVCSLNQDQVREYRGTVTTPGKESPDRDRPVEESLDLFARMKAGDFADGTYTLRAKIDMAHPNMHMRDPAIYRIRHLHHHRTGDEWCIYPMYDFAHCTSDSIEGVTHSFCTLEFEEHRPLYDWFLEKLQVHRPQQIEFARLNLSYLVLSKRKLVQLVEGKRVGGWDDPRMPTLAGMRRRGYTPAAIRTLCEKVGVSKVNSVNELALLESCVRDDLNKVATRGMAVLDPIRLVVTDWPEDKTIGCTASNNPEDPAAGQRTIPFAGEVWIEREDFLEDPPGKWFRLAPGKEVRLMHSYCVTCQEVVKDDDGRVVELRCTHDPATLGANPEGRKVKGVIHWVPVVQAVDAEVRLYENLFTTENPAEPPTPDGDWLDNVNPDSLRIVQTAKVEPALAEVLPETHLQFVRTGYFCADRRDHQVGQRPVFNRTVGLRDSWGKSQGAGGKQPQKGRPENRRPEAGQAEAAARRRAAQGLSGALPSHEHPSVGRRQVPHQRRFRLPPDVDAVDPHLPVLGPGLGQGQDLVRDGDPDTRLPVGQQEHLVDPPGRPGQRSPEAPGSPIRQGPLQAGGEVGAAPRRQGPEGPLQGCQRLRGARHRRLVVALRHRLERHEVDPIPGAHRAGRLQGLPHRPLQPGPIPG